MNRQTVSALFAALAIAASSAFGDTISTSAGGGSVVASQAAANTLLQGPSSIAFDAAGNYYFVEASESLGGYIRRVDTAGNITNFAGNGTGAGGGTVGGEGGQALDAPLGGMASLTFDASGNLYFIEAFRVRRIDTSGVVTTVAGNGNSTYSGDNGPATSAGMAPLGIAVVGSAIFISDGTNNRIRKVVAGVIQTIAGNGTGGQAGDGGPALQATVFFPGAMVGDGAGGVYFADGSPPFSPSPAPSRIRRIDAAGNISAVAGGQSLPCCVTTQMARDSAGNLYVSRTMGDAVYKVTSAGVGSTFATVAGPGGVAAAPTGEIYVSNQNNQIQRFDPAGVSEVVAGGGTARVGQAACVPNGTVATQANLKGVNSVAYDPAGVLHVAQSTPSCIYRVSAAGVLTVVAGTGVQGTGGDGGPATAAQFFAAGSIAFDAAGNLYVNDGNFGNASIASRIRRIDTSGVITTIAGKLNGSTSEGVPALDASLAGMSAIAIDGAGSLYVNLGSRIRKIDSTGAIRTVAGNGTFNSSGDGGPAILAGISSSTIGFDPPGNLLLADTTCRCVRRVDLDGRITTIAGGAPDNGNIGDGGPALSAFLRAASGIAVDADGRIYISDQAPDQARVRVVDRDGIIRTLAGNGTQGTSGDGGAPTAAMLNRPSSVAWNEATRSLDVVTQWSVRRIQVSDATPAAFTFASQSGITASTLVQSNALTPSGFDTTASIAVSGGEYSIGCGGTFTTAAGTITPGQAVCVRHTASAVANMDTVTTLSIGGRAGTFTSTTATGPGTFQVSATTLDFGPHSMRLASPAKSLIVTNTGAGPITLNSVKASTHFGATHSCTTIAPAASCTIDVTFAPQAEGAVNGTITVQLSPGTQVVNLSGVGERSLVTHYYRSILRRDPDNDGRAFWNAEAARIVAAGADLNETWYAMAASFFFSAEYAVFNRTNAEFLTDAYKTFFGRAPDTAGFDFWQQQMAGGMPREVVLAEFTFSPEFALITASIFGATGAAPEVNMVMDFYRGMLSRLPDNTGLAHWVGRFRTAQCSGYTQVRAEAEAIASEFALSPEYVGRNRTNAQYVGDVYNAFLRRGGDLSGVSYWIGRLDTQANTRAQLRGLFAGSIEFTHRALAVSNACVR